MIKEQEIFFFNLIKESNIMLKFEFNQVLKLTGWTTKQIKHSWKENELEDGAKEITQIVAQKKERSRAYKIG